MIEMTMMMITSMVINADDDVEYDAKDDPSVP